MGVICGTYASFWDYEWTDVEVLTYSGDSHHIYFWGHVDFELRTNYHIHTVKDYRFLFFIGPSWKMMESVVEMEVVVS